MCGIKDTPHVTCVAHYVLSQLLKQKTIDIDRRTRTAPSELNLETQQSITRIGKFYPTTSLNQGLVKL